MIQASDGTLFKIYRQHLSRQSSVFATSFSLPAPAPQSQKTTSDPVAPKSFADEEEGPVRDGSSDELALRLESRFSSEELGIFFEFVVNPNGWSKDLPSVCTLCAILKTCHFYDVQGGIDYATVSLEQHAEVDNFKSALRFRLGWEFSILPWIHRAFDELISVSVNDFPADDEELIGPQAFLVLAKTQARVTEHRLSLAISPPDPVHALCCHNHTYCKAQWDAAWLSIPAGVAGWLLRDELSGAEIHEKLNWFSCGTMTGQCVCLTCDQVQRETPEEKSVLRHEEVIIDEAVKELLRFVA
ncbi:hypothetical protein GGX14DRAFT_557924 [Mycena pura]|uniref:BTB domain-containing protein n=1 Tax=Mycena pura TaxID=153505 RepID=A0AAD6YM10_9AGAR|nr:hypothetical protein GGX14DRAFT_557924 [Mycena pura]